MCLVRVFIFIRKAEHMYEIFFILIWTENSLYPFVAYISSSLPYIPSIHSPYDQTPALQNLHRRLRTSTAELHDRRISSPPSAFEDPSPRSSFCRHRPITPRSRFESHFHLLCQWVLEQRVKSSFFTQMFWFLFFVFVFPHQSGKPIFPVLCLLLRWSFVLQS